MCKECLRIFCVPSCPSHASDTRCYCSLCEEGIGTGETYFLQGGVRICRSCLEHMDLDDLADLCGGTRAHLLRLLGATEQEA